MDILAIVVALWMVTMLVWRSDDDDNDHFNGGSGIVIIDRRRLT